MRTWGYEGKRIVMRSGGEPVITQVKRIVAAVRDGDTSLEEVPKAGFEWLAEGPDDWRKPWNDWLSTRYEQKALREERTPHYLTFRKL